MLMNFSRFFVALVFCLVTSAPKAQNDAVEKHGIFSFGVSLSDYNFVKSAKDSLGHNGSTTTQKGLFKPGNGSFGMQVSYWKHLIPHTDFSGNFGIDFSNFPAGFVKSDSIGQASVSVHLDGLIHMMVLADDAKVNPFLTTGLGGGYFGKQFALYALFGAGAALHFNKGGIVILQLQMRDALSSGIQNNFMYYSVAFAQDVADDGHKKSKNSKDAVIKNALAADTKQQLPQRVENIIVPNTTSLTNSTAKIRTKKFLHSLGHTKESKEDDNYIFPEVAGAEILKMSDDSVTYSIGFDFDRSELQGEAFAVLNKIARILIDHKPYIIHIGGHADNQGTEHKNMIVSAERAKVTYDYFMSYNIAAARITSSYYGAARPIDIAQQWRNRRVEVTIIKK